MTASILKVGDFPENLHIDEGDFLENLQIMCPCHNT